MNEPVAAATAVETSGARFEHAFLLRAGVLMLAAGALTGLVARFWGHDGALLLLTGMALAGAVSTLWLKDAG